MREQFEKHVEATSVCWVEEMRSRLFDRNKVGQYTWQGLESRFADFQAGHAAGLEAAATKAIATGWHVAADEIRAINHDRHS